MLEIHEVKDILYYKKIADRLPVHPQYPKAVEALSSEGEIIGSGIYSYDNDAVVIYTCDYGDDWCLGDGILRSILFKAMLKGVDKGVCLAEKDGVNLFIKMKYTKPDINIIESINDFLSGCRNCK